VTGRFACTARTASTSLAHVDCSKFSGSRGATFNGFITSFRGPAGAALVPGRPSEAIPRVNNGRGFYEQK
jgi:hypothetical protein